MAAAKRFVAAFEQNRVARRPAWKKKTSPIELSFEKEAETKAPEEGQDLDRQENRRYRSGGDRDRGEEERDRDEARRLGAEAADSRSPRPVAWSPRLATASRSRAPIVAALAPPRPPASGSASRVDTPLLRKATRG